VRYKVILNTDIHTEPGTHWVAIHLYTRSSSDYFDSDSSRSEKLQHSHAAVFQHRRVRTVYVSLRFSWTGSWALANMSTCLGRGSLTGRWKGLSCGSLAGGIRAPTMASEACSAVPAEKVSVSIPLTCEEGSACVWRTSNNRSRCLLQPYEGRASTLRSSLCEMPVYKNFKQLVAQHRRAIRQASGDQALGSQLPPPRPPLEAPSESAGVIQVGRIRCL